MSLRCGCKRLNKLLICSTNGSGLLNLHSSWFQAVQHVEGNWGASLGGEATLSDQDGEAPARGVVAYACDVELVASNASV
jgi:hypothetical protein